MRIFREVTFEIEHTKILDNVNLDIDSGINILQGKNGVGKSTLLKIILGMIPLEKGKILVHDKMGYVPDSSELYFGELTPQNLFTLLCDESQNKVKSVETMEKFINIFEFDSSILNKRIKKLSLGQRKKVMIVAGHLNVSSLILMDEPFSGLDSESLSRFIEFLNQSDITYLIVSHEMDISSLIVVNHFVLQSGKIEYFNE